MEAMERMEILKPLAAYRDTILKTGISLDRENVPKKPIKRLIRLFGDVPDERLDGKILYPLAEMLATAFFAILAGAQTWTDIASWASEKEKWLRRFLRLENGIPSHDTFRRVFGLVAPEFLQKATVTFLTDNMKLMKRAFQFPDEGYRQYCVDGKEARGTGRDPGPADAKIRNLQTLHVYDLSDGICLVSKAIDAKRNEIPAAQEALSAMQLKGVIVSFDAMNTQRETISAIARQKGDYVGALKGNQEGLFEEVQSYFTADRMRKIAGRQATFHMTKEKARNCIETRKFYLTRNVDWFYGIEQWENLRSFVCYVKTSENVRTGKTTSETRCYISSLTDVRLCADAIRGHWSVESYHWHLDVNFGEDANMTVDRSAFQNFSLMNKLALSLTKLAAPVLRASVRSTRKISGWDIDKMAKILCSFDEDILAEALGKVAAKQ
jgi:predicted transposase YbfD/YdcC